MENRLLTESYYLPGKETLLVQADFSNFLVDYYLTLKKNKVLFEREHDEQLKQLMAGFAVHLTHRPPDESVGWTLLMHGERPYSLFVTGSVIEQAIVGQVLYHKIRHTDVNVFNQQTSRPAHPPFQSSVRCESGSIEDMLETFYTQSEQLPFKIRFRSDADKAAALIAMPGFDPQWFGSVDPLQAAEDLSSVRHKLIKQCSFAFACSCSLEKLLPFFRAIPREQLEELYGNDPILLINCPRCGRTFELPREGVTTT